MEHTTLSPPLCSKHGCEKVWSKNKAHHCGGQWRCRPCANKWPAQQLEPIRPLANEWEPPICKKHNRAKAWRKNKGLKSGGFWDCTECARKRNASYRVENLESIKSRESAYRAANPEQVAAKEQRRRARELAATSPLVVVTAAVIAERFALTDGCAYCGAEKKLTLDHVVPLNNGGLHVPSNLVGACGCCNSSKNANPVEEWFKAQPFFSEQRWQRIQTITGNGQLSLI